MEIWSFDATSSFDRPCFGSKRENQSSLGRKLTEAISKNGAVFVQQEGFFGGCIGIGLRSLMVYMPQNSPFFVTNAI